MVEVRSLHQASLETIVRVEASSRRREVQAETIREGNGLGFGSGNIVPVLARLRGWASHRPLMCSRHIGRLLNWLRMTLNHSQTGH